MSASKGNFLSVFYVLRISLKEEEVWTDVLPGLKASDDDDNICICIIGNQLPIIFLERSKDSF